MDRHQTILVISIALAVITVLVGVGNSISAQASSGLVILADINPEEFDDYFEGGELKDKTVEEINESIGQFPDFLIDLFSNSTTNVSIVTNNNEEKLYNVSVEEDKVVGVKRGHITGAGASVVINEESIKKIANATEPIEELAAAINSGEIKYESQSPETKLNEIIIGSLSFFLGIIMAVFSFFKSIFG